MVSVYSFQKFRDLNKVGKNYSEIARETGINRKTVAKYLKSNQPPKYKERLAPTKVDYFISFEGLIIEKLKEVPDWTCGEIFEWLKARGYLGSLRTIERRVQRIKGQQPKERFFEQEYHPGRQCQFDFKESVELPFMRGSEIVHLHFGTLPYSDRCQVKGFPQKNYECFIEGLHAFFESIGGIPGEVRIDNLSPCIKKILKDGKRLYTKAFDAAIKYYGLNVLPCSPGRGNEKGDVERDIRTWATRFKNHVKVEGLVFRDFDHLNEVLARFLNQTGNPVKFREEQLQLAPLPKRDLNILCRVEERRATAFGTIAFGKSVYSVPDDAINIWCEVIGDPFKVQIVRLDTKKLIASHKRQPDGFHSIQLAHSITGLLRKPGAMLNWSHREILFPSPICKSYYRELKKQSQVPEKDYLKSINLVQHTTLDEIITGMELVLQSKVDNLYEALRSLILGDRRPDNVINIVERYGQQPLQPNLKDYDQLIPKGGAI